jgi:Ni/Fe-hydrogenase subunit HybB-like protein
MTALFLEANMSNDDDWYLLIGVLQFFVGVAQIIGAIFRTIMSLFDKTDFKKLARYWLMVFVYFSI